MRERLSVQVIGAENGSLSRSIVGVLVQVIVEAVKGARMFHLG